MKHTAPAPLPLSHRRHEAGVTLVELSIVLVILALLTAGVISGISLLRNAEFRRVITDFQHYQMAITNFQTKYGGLPGDTTIAAATWGMAPSAAAPAANDSACAALTGSSPSQGTRTCNGDGDGTIAVGYEEFRAWQHLSNAGEIDDHFTGVGTTGTAGLGFQSGLNCPKSPFRDACWRVFYRDSTASQRLPFRLFEGDYETHLFSLWGGVREESHFTPVLLPAEMWELDNKIDDGKPATGAVIVPYGSGAGNPFAACTRSPGGNPAAAGDTDAVYYNEGKDRACQIYIKATF